MAGYPLQIPVGQPQPQPAQGSDVEVRGLSPRRLLPCSPSCCMLLPSCCHAALELPGLACILLWTTLAFHPPPNHGHRTWFVVAQECYVHDCRGPLLPVESKDIFPSPPTLLSHMLKVTQTGSRFLRQETSDNSTAQRPLHGRLLAVMSQMHCFVYAVRSQVLTLGRHPDILLCHPLARPTRCRQSLLLPHCKCGACLFLSLLT